MSLEGIGALRQLSPPVRTLMTSQLTERIQIHQRLPSVLQTTLPNSKPGEPTTPPLPPPRRLTPKLKQTNLVGARRYLVHAHPPTPFDPSRTRGDTPPLALYVLFVHSAEGNEDHTLGRPTGSEARSTLEVVTVGRRTTTKDGPRCPRLREAFRYPRVQDLYGRLLLVNV
ncbi:hypothetical protein P692DRAFT_201868466 [Suillus brevipes Sb2]|nr:hypothetical protein P692DRAFT_201868466 [Suillus brevipes Sb2]